MRSERKKLEKKTRRLKTGDPVMVIAGGNKKKRLLVGKTGKILRFQGTDRVVVEGLNMITRHQRASGPDKPGGRIQREGSIHVSNIMYYVEKISKPVRVKYQFLADGRKVRGYLDPKSKAFVQLDA